MRVRALSRRSRERFSTALGQEEDHGHFFLFVPVFLGVGAVCWFSLGRPAPTLVIAVLFFIAVAVFALAGSGRRVGRCGLAAVSLWLAGMLAADFESRRMATTILDTGVTTVLTGIVERREPGANGEWRYVLRLSSTAEPRLKRPPERVSLVARGRHQPVLLGERLTGRARLSPPSGPALPGLNDFAFANYFDGVGAVGFFLGAPQGLGSAAELGEEGDWSIGERWLFSLRDGISERLRNVIGGDAGAFATAIITGERRSMSRATTEALRLSGLAHITAISGLHMALASGIFFVGLRMLLSLLPGVAQGFAIKKLAAAGALMAAFAYLLISGHQVSAVRAFVMTAIMLVAVLFDRPAVSLRNLAIAAIVIIAITPSAVMGPSFQMSFGATAALIAGYAAWRARPRRNALKFKFPGAGLLGATGRLIGATFLTSLIGGLSTAIFAIAHFHRLAPHGMEANLAAMPIISLMVMPAGLGAMLLMPFGLDAPLLWLMGLGLDWVLLIARAVAGWDDAIGFTRMPAWFLPSAATGLLLMTLLRTRLRHVGTVLFAGSITIVAMAPAHAPAEVVISEDGGLVGLRVAERRLATNRVRPPRFVFEQWRAALGLDEHVAPEELSIQTEAKPLPHRASAPSAVGADRPQTDTRRQERQWSNDELIAVGKRMQTALQDDGVARFRCEPKAWCVARLSGGWTIATVDETAFVGPACDTADIVVTARRMAFPSCRSGARLFTAETLRATGAVELHLGRLDIREVVVTTSLSEDLRPWSVHRLYDWRTNRFLEPGMPGSPNSPKPVDPAKHPGVVRVRDDVNDSGE
ncbi:MULTISPECIES: ComEC/Rec2 family competence protein [Alphaproteobacteria]|uniref:Membrane protein n=2 Tax=Alphaproteobacteria TaxID=28211 RepID=A0A512HCT1_9HYPH|nr:MULTISPECIES: ComEC/Rec2 family competence protein [Alphaproteobacteria]GEO83258.1 membrane protein [Ciceribacter naphthalenivorans]GLR20347.1 membrane protein [Ciceribacter naphthalenivorans]GLT03203.1 membrane protein [Sphingomonas psychrolutea]